MPTKQIWFALAWLVLHNSAGAQPPSLNEASSARPMPAQRNAVQSPSYSPLVASSAADASLNSIALITEDRLCVVGDRGIILTSENAGRNWDQQPAVTTSNLHAVAFDGESGLAVGGWIGNLTGSSYGVVLKSIDAGRTWTALPAEQLSRLIGISFSRDRVIAWGDYSPQLGASVFESFDGGLTWRGLPIDIGHARAVGVARDGAMGAVDSLGRAFFTRHPRGQTVADPSTPIHDLLHTGQRWVACGNSGEVLSSIDGGTWSNCAVPLSPEARVLLDCHAVESHAEHVWVCGAPGSILLHSGDGGEHWRCLPTGQTLPLNDIRFVDKNRGWMVGAQGLILATRDGGLTWYPQRQQAQRAALLAVAQDQDSVPWTPLVAAAWDDRVAVASLVTQADEPLELADFTPNSATRFAAWAPQIGVAQHDTWSAANQTPEQANRRLAVALLSWRPDVVLTDERGLGESDTDSAPALSVNRALQLAADSAALLPVANELGLKPWQVSKLVAVTEGASSQYNEQSSRVLSAPGLSLWDILLPLPPDVQRRCQSVAMRTVWSRSQATVVSTSLLGGSLRDASTARELTLGTLGNFQLVMGRIHRNKSLDRIVEQPSTTHTNEQWSADLSFVLQTLPETEIGPALVLQAKRAMELGNFSRQEILLETLASRSSTRDAAQWARFELLRLASSDEFAAWRRFSEEPSGSTAVGGEIALASGQDGSAAISQAVWNASPFETQATAATATLPDAGVSAVVSAAASEQLEASPQPADRPRKLQWLGLLDQLAQSMPALLVRTDVQLLLARNMLRADNSASHLQQLESVASKAWMVGWKQAARQELMLATDQPQQLKWMAFAARAAAPPVLDGQLDEPFWTQVPAMSLSTLQEESATPGARIFWGFDDNYVYIGVDCPRTSPGPHLTPASLRTYDADLSQLDHVQFRLDTDRDYSTAIELGIAENGQTYDRCCNYQSFNPKWHVMVKSERESWRAEVAIERSALTTEPTLEGAAWAIAACRHRPGAEAESWSQLRTHSPLLYGSGLLLFAPGELE